MNELPPIPLTDAAATRIRSVVRASARAARVHAGEAALHVGFSLAAVAWALGLLV